MPKSPCAASAGWTKNEGVPVDANVAAILRAICPDLPMPETTTRPLQASIMRTACAKPGASSWLSRVCNAINASASICKVSVANSTARSAALSMTSSDSVCVS